VISTANAFAAAALLLGARSLGRMLATGAGDPIPAAQPGPSAGTVAALVPVLDERLRLGPCLEGLLAQPPSLVQIVVSDGGSTDGTQELVRSYAARDARIRLIDASPVPAGWNGTAWGLAAALAASDPAADWILGLDADVRPGPQLTNSLLAHAEHAYLDAFSATPLLRLSGPLETLLHPALLATLVYRQGLPGSVARAPRDAQANGQCFFARRPVLVSASAFAAARTSRSDDLTIARRLISLGAQVGFFEGGRLAQVEMYASLMDCLRNWPRSLPLRDATTGDAEVALAFAELTLVQALPLAIVLGTLALRRPTNTLLFRVNLALALARFGVLAGMRRAYATPAWTYWLSPFADLPAVVLIAAATLRRAPRWRGRTLVPEGRHA
jgi:dolichol-phosphate mannosyltransferase